MDSWKMIIIVLKEHEMLKIIDPGCIKHNQRQFTLDGVAAEIMGDILYNLPKTGGLYTFICEYGHTHQISFNVQVAKLYRLSAMFSGKGGRSGRPRPEQAHANR
jgi:hypothetical protein